MMLGETITTSITLRDYTYRILRILRATFLIVLLVLVLNKFSKLPCPACCRRRFAARLRSYDHVAQTNVHWPSHYPDRWYGRAVRALGRRCRIVAPLCGCAIESRNEPGASGILVVISTKSEQVLGPRVSNQREE